jgi:hypothetical protein
VLVADELLEDELRHGLKHPIMDVLRAGLSARAERLAQRLSPCAVVPVPPTTPDFAWACHAINDV